MKKRKIQMSGRKIKQLLELRSQSYGIREASRVLHISTSTAHRWIQRCKAKGVDHEKAKGLSEEALREIVREPQGPKLTHNYEPNIEQACQKLDEGYSKRSLYQEYVRSASGSGKPALCQSAYYERINKFLAKKETPNREMVQTWPAGEYMQIDYAGDKITLFPEADGKQYTVRIFACVLCFSRMVFYYATPNMTTESWIEACVAALEYFGGVPKYILCDNDTALVNRATTGEKEYSRLFVEFCNFYRTIPRAVRPSHPRDKGMVEDAVKIITNRFIKQIKPGSLHTIEDVRVLLVAEIERINTSKMAKYGINRREWFEKESPHLKSLPARRFNIYGPLLTRVVGNDGCVRVDGHYYMAPYAYMRKKILIRIGKDTKLHLLDPVSKLELCSYPHYKSGEIDIIEGFKHVDKHLRLPGELTPQERFEKALDRVMALGPKAEEFFSKLYKSKVHEEKGYLADILNRAAKELEKEDPKIVEIACEQALEMGNKDLRSLQQCVKDIKEDVKKVRRIKKLSSNKGACLRSKDDLFGIRYIQ